ncbi:hypothetical protein AgCh_025285 [Apium graveolens]
MKKEMNDGEEVVVVGNTNKNTNKEVNMEKTDYVYKVVVIGDSAMGKSFCPGLPRMSSVRTLNQPLLLNFRPELLLLTPNLSRRRSGTLLAKKVKKEYETHQDSGGKEAGQASGFSHTQGPVTPVVLPVSEYMFPPLPPPPPLTQEPAPPVPRIVHDPVEMFDLLEFFEPMLPPSVHASD